MARWALKTKAYDYDDELMVKGALIRSGIDYIKKLEQEEEILLNSMLEINEGIDSFMITQYKIEVNNITKRHLFNNKKMSNFIQDKEVEIISLFERVLEDDDSSARLAEFYLYSAALRGSTDKLIRLISYTPITKKGYITLYQNLYHEIKKTIEWYYGKDESKTTEWKFYTTADHIGNYISLFSTNYKFKPIDTTEKPIRKAASFITYLITSKKPNPKNDIPYDNLQYIL